MLQYFVGGLISFVSVFLKGFQHQNVIGGHFKWAFFISYAMALADVAIINFAVDRGWAMALPMGTGAALGIVTSMWLHRRYLNSKE
jgi:hypothetical protein